MAKVVKPPVGARGIAGIIVALIGLGLAGVGGWGLLSVATDHDWPSVEGTIVDLRVGRRHKVSRNRNQTPYWYRVEVYYQYDVDGRAFQGHRHSLMETHEEFGTEEDRDQRLRALRAADSITVYYDPATPSDTVLEKSEVAPAVAVSIVGSFLLLLGSILLGGDLSRRRRERRLAALELGRAYPAHNQARSRPAA